MDGPLVALGSVPLDLEDTESERHKKKCDLLSFISFYQQHCKCNFEDINTRNYNK